MPKLTKYQKLFPRVKTLYGTQTQQTLIKMLVEYAQGLTNEELVKEKNSIIVSSIIDTIFELNQCDKAENILRALGVYEGVDSEEVEDYLSGVSVFWEFGDLKDQPNFLELLKLLPEYQQQIELLETLLDYQIKLQTEPEIEEKKENELPF